MWSFWFIYMLTFTAKLYLKMGRYSEAEDLYRDLLDRNPECWEYYTKLEESVKPGKN